MAAETSAKPTMRERSIHELKQLAILSAYFYITFGAVIMMKAAVLHDQGIDFAPWGIAAVKALVLAKFMLIGHAMKLGERHAARPLIWPTLQQAFAFLVLLVILTIIEEVVVGLFHQQPVSVSISNLFGAKLYESLASILILLLVLLPYCAIRTLSQALGEGRLVRMFFVERVPTRADKAGLELPRRKSAG